MINEKQARERPDLLVLRMRILREIENEGNTQQANRAIRVLEILPGFLISAHPLHASLLQGGRSSISLLTGDQRGGLLLLQKY